MPRRALPPGAGRARRGVLHACRDAGRFHRDEEQAAEAVSHGGEGSRASTRYSITWSARPSTDGGIVSPRARAVFRLMTNSNFVGCSTGRSAGLAPLRILST
jgi:hypothetical protein